MNLHTTYYLSELDFANTHIYSISLWLRGKRIGKADLTLNNSDPSDVVTLSFVGLLQDYQGKGYGKDLYRAISEVYTVHLTGKRIKRTFCHKNAFYLANWSLQQGYFPKESWDESLIDFSTNCKKELLQMT